jgi:hypothetical protein
MIKYVAFTDYEDVMTDAHWIKKKGQNKKMRRKSWQGKSIRTTITMNRKLYRDCQKLMELHGYGDNFSAYIADAARWQKRRLARVSTEPVSSGKSKKVA